MVNRNLPTWLLTLSAALAVSLGGAGTATALTLMAEGEILVD